MNQQTETTEQEQDRTSEHKSETPQTQNSTPDVDWRHLCLKEGFKRVGRHQK